MATRIRLGGRRLWFQLHKWIALLLLVLLIPIAVSGSMLVWDAWTDSLVNPQRYAVSESPARLPVGRYVAAARTVLKAGENIASIELPAEPGTPIVVSAATAPSVEKARRGPPLRHQVWLDPASARVLDHAASGGGLVRTLHVLHGSLMLPGIGRTIVGWLGVAMLILSLTGLWLWVPTAGRLLRGFRWSRGRGVSNNLHHQAGVWISLPLAILSFTGAWISFPGLFEGRGGGGAPVGQFAPPLARPVNSPDAVMAAALRKAPGDPTSLRWPTERDRTWTVTVQAKGERSVLAVDDRTGEAAIAPERTTRRGLMRVLHDGTGTGPIWQTIIFVAGLAPAVLGITGVIMWLRSCGWRRQLRRRKAEARR
ncbi:MAG: PepSY-associated TM helix domain-containing protein [Sphingomonadales bacterium]